jgi:hypothetical protein
MASQKKTEHKSALALALEQRERPVHEFEVQGFFGLGNKEIHKIGIRVNTKSEEDDAVVGAHRNVRQKASNGAESALDDPDLINDSKAVEALFRACREVGEDGDKKYMYPAFPGPSWMRSNLTTDQISTLLNFYHDVRRREAPEGWNITVEEIEDLAEACAHTSGSDYPDIALISRPQEWVVQAFIILSVKYMEMKDVLQSHSEPEKPGPDDVDGGEET